MILCCAEQKGRLAVTQRKQTRFFPFEELFGDNPRAALLQIITFLEIDPSRLTLAPAEQRVNTNPQQLVPDVQGWTKQQRRAADEITEPMRLRLGYPAMSSR